MSRYLKVTNRENIAKLADTYKDLLRVCFILFFLCLSFGDCPPVVSLFLFSFLQPDEGAQYDKVVEIDLSTLVC
jgi:hypothetical protein